jgi:molybdenum cofactor cytidylyltransferase
MAMSDSKPVAGATGAQRGEAERSRNDRNAAAAFVTGVILAAGASRRMGCPKLLLPLGDRPLLQHVLEAAAASRLDEIVLVLGDRAAVVLDAIRLPSRRPVRVAVNEGPASGQSSSLRLGLRSADPRASAAAILLGDQPGVTGPLIDRVVAAFLGDGAPVVRPVYCGSHERRVPGHPVLVARRIWPEVETLRGDEGMRGLLARRPEWLFEVSVEGEPPGDVDTPEDYRSAAEARE